MATEIQTAPLSTTPSFTSSSGSSFSAKPSSPTTTSKLSSSPLSKTKSNLRTRNTTMLPYRDENNTTISYYSPNPQAISPTQTQPTTPGYCEYVTNLERNYDSDAEPLIRPASPSSIYSTAVAKPGEAQGLTEDEMQNFTATGRPMPAFKQSALANVGGLYTVPQLLPKRYTDDSIIPAIVTGVIPSVIQPTEQKRRGSIMGKLRGKKEDKKAEEGIVKVVYMPRRDYIKHFKRDEKSEYCGTEPYRRWTEEELEESFGRYKPAPPVNTRKKSK